MTTRKISFTLEGLAQDEGRLGLETVLRELALVEASLRRADRLESGREMRSFRLRILEIHYKSPLAVVLESVPLEGETDFFEPAAIRFMRVFDSVSRNVVDPSEDLTLVRNSRAMIKFAGREFKTATLEVENQSVTIGLEQAALRAVGRQDEELEPGYITGQLEAINIHGGANTFFVYPKIGPNRVRCIFPDHLKQDAMAALGGFVQVDGIMRFATGRSFPHAIDVSAIEVYPPDESLPSLYDLRGIAPDIAGGIPSEVFIRRLREAGTVGSEE